MWKKEIFLFLLLVFLSGFLLFLDKKGWLKPVRGFWEKPFLVAEQKVYFIKQGFDSFACPIIRRRALEKELFRLQLETQRLAIEQNQLNSCLEENEKMRRMLGAPVSTKWKFLPAKVISVSDQMKIDKGAKDGLKEEMVILSENILVGKITKVGEGSSLVQLPISLGVKIPVVVRRPPFAKATVGVQARGLLIGEYGGRLILDRVLQEEDIQKGDLVVTAGEDWLPDLIIGQVSEVLPKSAEIYRKALVKPLVDYDKLRIVFIIISN